MMQALQTALHGYTVYIYSIWCKRILWGPVTSATGGVRRGGGGPLSHPGRRVDTRIGTRWAPYHQFAQGPGSAAGHGGPVKGCREQGRGCPRGCDGAASHRPRRNCCLAEAAHRLAHHPDDTVGAQRADREAGVQRFEEEFAAILDQLLEGGLVLAIFNDHEIIRERL